jgi:benzoate/toluate 1,2-dioxygenase beta subunit
MLDQPALVTIPIDDLRGVERFLIHEVQLLDERRFEEWRDLFAEDGIYWVPLEPDQASPEGRASLFYDDKRMMDIRFERLRHPNIHSQSPPHRTCHVIGKSWSKVSTRSRECTVISNMIMTDYRMSTQRLFPPATPAALTARATIACADLINRDA